MNRPSASSRWLKRHMGFTLLEVAVVLVLVSVLGLAALNLTHPCCSTPPAALARAGHAVTTFARMNGRLPCADLNGDGEEDCGNAIGAGAIPWRLLGLERSEAQPPGAVLIYQPNSDLAQPALAGVGGTIGAHKALQQRVQLIEVSPMLPTQPYQASPSPSGYGDCSLPARRLGYVLIVARDAGSLHLPCAPTNLPPNTWMDAVEPFGVLAATLVASGWTSSEQQKHREGT